MLGAVDSGILGSLLASERMPTLLTLHGTPGVTASPHGSGPALPHDLAGANDCERDAFLEGRSQGSPLDAPGAETSLSASTSSSASPASLPLPPLPLHLHRCILPLEVFILIRVTVGELVDVDLLLFQLVPDLGADMHRW